MDYIIFHYKEQGEWYPFSLNVEDSNEWRNFCCKLALSRPYSPSPNYIDYLSFFETLRQK